MLQLAHRTWAPSATRGSIRTAVWVVMCSEPGSLVPRSGWACAYSARIAIRPGISCSASVISLRPNSASERSATLNGRGSGGLSPPPVARAGLLTALRGALLAAPRGCATPTVRDDRALAHARRVIFDRKMLDLLHAHHGGRTAARHLTPDAALPGPARPAAPPPRAGRPSAPARPRNSACLRASPAPPS